MVFLCVYVDGGKGHYVPAKAVSEQLEALGHKTYFVDFFELLNIRLAGKINKFVWKKLLEHSRFENRFSKNNDQHTWEIRSVSSLLKKIRMKRFIQMMDEYRPDMIFTTHPYPDYFLSDMATSSGLGIPVTYYATDVFAVPMSAISNRLYRMYVSTEEGRQSALQHGQMIDKVSVVPFPLQASCKNTPRYTKQEARRRLGLDEDTFTLQINYGGEGVGATDLLEALASVDEKLQVVIIGGIPDKTRSRLEQIVSRMPSNVSVNIAGFVSNVNEYNLASDMIAGRSGINTLVEAFYLRRPFLITEIVYTVMASADYVEKYNLGWNASQDAEKQLKIITSCIHNPSILEDMDRNFDLVPIEYDAMALARILVEDAQEASRKQPRHQESCHSGRQDRSCAEDHSKGQHRL